LGWKRGFVGVLGLPPQKEILITQKLQAATKKVKKNYWVNQIEIQRLAATAWVILSERKN